MRPWTVRVILRGRRDGKPCKGVGERDNVGEFRSYTRARAAVTSWENDPTYLWSAQAVQMPGRRRLVQRV